MSVKLRCVNAISDVRRLRSERAISDVSIQFQMKRYIFECGREVSNVSAWFQMWGCERALWMRRFRVGAVSGGDAMWWRRWKIVRSINQVTESRLRCVEA